MPKFTLSTQRLYRLLILLFVIAGARRVTYTIDAVRDMAHQYSASPFSLREPWPTIDRLNPSARMAGLQSGDRVLFVGGRPALGYRDFALAFHNRGLQEAVPITLLRDGQTLALSVKPGVLGFGRGWLAIMFGALSWILMPWTAFLLGFWVTALRPRDPRAWIVLGITLGIAENDQRGHSQLPRLAGPRRNHVRLSQSGGRRVGHFYDAVRNLFPPAVAV
jgi:hypothetical protein